MKYTHVNIKDLNKNIEKNKKILEELKKLNLSNKKYKKYKNLFFNGTLTEKQEVEIIKLLAKKEHCERELKKARSFINGFEEKRIEKLQEQKSDKEKNNDEYIRIIADLENKIKLLQKEHKNELNKKEFSILKDILPILDTLEIALENIPNNNENKPFYEGIENTIKKFYSILENYGIEPVEHKEFNPEYHQAIGTEKGPDNQILKVYQKGFKKGDILLRPGLVIVGKKN